MLSDREVTELIRKSLERHVTSLVEGRGGGRRPVMLLCVGQGWRCCVRNIRRKGWRVLILVLWEGRTHAIGSNLVLRMMSLISMVYSSLVIVLLKIVLRKVYYLTVLEEYITWLWLWHYSVIFRHNTRLIFLTLYTARFLLPVSFNIYLTVLKPSNHGIQRTVSPFSYFILVPILPHNLYKTS